VNFFPIRITVPKSSSDRAVFLASTLVGMELGLLSITRKIIPAPNDAIVAGTVKLGARK